MAKLKRVFRIIPLFVCLLASPAALAGWSLEPGQSHIYFISTKKNDIAEVHTFRKLRGSVSQAGHVELSIGLGSVDTAIPVRDERLSQYLFEVADFPSATAKTDVDLGQVIGLLPGKSQLQDISLSLSLHGYEHVVPATVRVTRLSQNQMRVDTTRPLVLQAADYGLLSGVAKLAELAKLPMISKAVPVTASLLFVQAR